MQAQLLMVCIQTTAAQTQLRMACIQTTHSTDTTSDGMSTNHKPPPQLRMVYIQTTHSTHNCRWWVYKPPHRDKPPKAQTQWQMVCTQPETNHPQHNQTADGPYREEKTPKYRQDVWQGALLSTGCVTRDITHSEIPARQGTPLAWCWTQGWTPVAACSPYLL